MSTQSKKMPMLDIKMFVRVVAAVFSISSATAFVFALLRFLNPELFYLELPLIGSNIIIHYITSGLMVMASAIGFLNSCVVMNREAAQNGRGVTTWLLLDSLFETSRVIYVFVCEIVLKGKGPLQIYDLLISAAQYLLDSFLYCQIILKH